MLTASSYFNQNPFTSSTGDTGSWNKFGQDSGYTSGFKFDSPNYSSTFDKNKPDPGDWLKAYTQNMNLSGEDKDKYRSSYTQNQPGTGNGQQQQQGFGGQQFGGGSEGSFGNVAKLTDTLTALYPAAPGPITTVPGMPGQAGKPGLVQQLSPLLGLIPGVGPALAFGTKAVAGHFNV